MRVSSSLHERMKRVCLRRFLWGGSETDAFDGACAHEWLSGQDRSSGAGRGFESASPGRGQTPHFVEPWGGCCTLADRRRAHRDSHRGLHHSGRRRPRNVRRDRRRKRAQRCLCHGRTSFDRAESGLFSHLLFSDVGPTKDSHQTVQAKSHIYS